MATSFRLTLSGAPITARLARICYLTLCWNHLDMDDLVVWRRRRSEVQVKGQITCKVTFVKAFKLGSKSPLDLQSSSSLGFPPAPRASVDRKRESNRAGRFG